MSETVADPGPTRSAWLERQGIVRPLAWGYVAVLLFMVGDGIELGFMAPYLEGLGFSTSNIAALVTVYGVVVAIASWLAGALVEAWGPRRVMLIGFAVWVIFEIIFLAVGVATKNYPVMLVSYAIRGLGYPFFAYGFLVWVTIRTPDAVISRAVGWYWFSYTAGLGVISSYFAGFTIPLVGGLTTMWLSLAFVGAGGLISMFLIRAKSEATAAGLTSTIRSVVRGLTIMKDHPRIGVGGFVRIINGLIFYALPLFFASHLINDVGFSITEWQSIWGTMLLATLPGNLAAGYLGDRIGLVNVVAWFGGLLLSLSLLAWYFVPLFLGPNFIALMTVSIISGLGLGGFTPLTPLVALLSRQHKAAAVAVVNLGAGLSNAVGPAIVRIFLGPLGVAGVTFILAGLYAMSIPLTYLLRQRQPAPTKGQAPDLPVATTL